MRNRTPDAPLRVKIMHGTLITMDSERRILPDGSVGVAGDTIAFVGPGAELESTPAELTIDARGQVVLPGLMARVGVRDILGVGTPNPPYPKTFRRWSSDGAFREYSLSHADSFDKTREAVRRFHGRNGGLTLCFPTPSGVGRREPLSLEEHVAQNRAMRDISEEFGVPVHAHSYAGDVAFAREHFPFMLGPWLSLAHCTGISDEEVRILADTGVSVCSGPATGSYIKARCPVVELIEAGCNVTLCTDASAPPPLPGAGRSLFEITRELAGAEVVLEQPLRRADTPLAVDTRERGLRLGANASAAP